MTTRIAPAFGGMLTVTRKPNETAEERDAGITLYKQIRHGLGQIAEQRDMDGFVMVHREYVDDQRFHIRDFFFRDECLPEIRQALPFWQQQAQKLGASVTVSDTPSLTSSKDLRNFQLEIPGRRLISHGFDSLG
jgi:hypothetical protein